MNRKDKEEVRRRLKQAAKNKIGKRHRNWNWKKIGMYTTLWFTLLCGIGLVAYGAFRPQIAPTYIRATQHKYKEHSVNNGKPTQRKVRPEDKVQYKSSDITPTSDFLKMRQQGLKPSGPKNIVRGAMYIPVQPGVATPVEPMPISEGWTDSGLYYGAVTGKPNQKMGQGNYATLAHNYFDNKTHFSPLQSQIDVDKQPLVYLRDEHNLYVYQLNRRSNVKSDGPYIPGKQPSGWRKVPYTEGNVINDDEYSKETPALTMQTCYMTKTDFKRPYYRVIVRGSLVAVKPFNQAPSSIKSAFNNM